MLSKMRNITRGVPLLIIYIIYSNMGNSGADGKYGYYGRTLMRVLTTTLKPAQGEVVLNNMLYCQNNYRKIRRKKMRQLAVMKKGRILYAGDVKKMLECLKCSAMFRRNSIPTGGCSPEP